MARLSVGVAVPLAVGALVLPASGQGATMANRFAPSGVVTVRDGPASAPVSPDTLRALAADGASVVGPAATGTTGCPDRSATNVRVNQDCTNQTNVAIGTGLGQAQNEPAVAVNPGNARNIVAG